MEVLLPNYTVSDIRTFDLQMAMMSNLLWVLHADKIPPHIGVSVNGLFYSLKANGKDEGVAIEGLVEIVNRRKISTLCFELNSTFDESTLSEEFRKFDKTIPNQVTCLRPIKNSLKHDSATKLVDLLQMLEENEEIGLVMGIHIKEDFEGIQDYDVEAIHARLKLLNK